MKRRNYFVSAFFMALLIITPSIGFISCDDDDDSTPLAYWVIALSSKYENPSLTNRPEFGVLQLQLLEGGTLNYAITVEELKSDDHLTMAHLHVGDVMTNGGVILDFGPMFDEGTTSGAILLRPTLVDSLLDSKNQIYFNVHSQQQPAGLVRGQINTDIVFTSSVLLSGANEVPSVSSPASGSAVVRVTREGMGMGNRKVYSNVTVDNLESADQLSTAGVYYGNAGQTGDLYLPLCSSASDFGVNKSKSVDRSDISGLYTSDSYINVISMMYPGGLVRGQVKNDFPNPYLQSDPDGGGNY